MYCLSLIRLILIFKLKFFKTKIYYILLYMKINILLNIVSLIIIIRIILYRCLASQYIGFVQAQCIGSIYCKKIQVYKREY